MPCPVVDMTFGAGGWLHVADDGTRYSLAQRISVEQLDLLHRVLKSAGLEPADVESVTFDGEQPPLIVLRSDLRP